MGSGMEEFGPITGKSYLRSAASALASEGRTVIARDGAGPVLVAMRQGGDTIETIKLLEIPVEPVDVISTVGAGDSFDAAFIHAYNIGRELSDCVRFANRIAGHVISHPGHLDVGTECI